MPTWVIVTYIICGLCGAAYVILDTHSHMERYKPEFVDFAFLLMLAVPGYITGVVALVSFLFDHGNLVVPKYNMSFRNPLYKRGR